MLQPKINISDIPEIVHGGKKYEDFCIEKSEGKSFIDFSVNSNPFGPPPGLKKILRQINLTDYPDSYSVELRNILANKYHMDINNFIIGNGSTEIIRIITTTYFDNSRKVIIFKPTYNDYEIANRLTGTSIAYFNSYYEENYMFDIDKLINFLKREKPDGIFICNPNNPTGQYFTKRDIQNILSINPNMLVILDEAYITFSENTWSSLELLNYENLIILRSFTKDFAIAGLRLGYAISNIQIITSLYKVKPPWNVSSIAQITGEFCLRHEEYIIRCAKILKETKSFLLKNIKSLGFSIIPSQSNFFLVEVGNAQYYFLKLKQMGILVRDCTSFGLPEFIRISARGLNDCKILINALKEIKQNYKC